MPSGTDAGEQRGERLGHLRGHLRPARTWATSSPPSTSATSSALDRVLLVVSNVPWQKVGTRAISPAAGPARHGGGGGRRRRGARGQPHRDRRRRPVVHRRHPGHPPGRGPRPRAVRDPGRRRRRRAAHVGAWEEVRDLATVVVVERPGRRSRPTRRRAGAGSQVEVPRLEVSSTDLRARAVDGRPLDYLVTHEVADWIEAHGLYRGERVRRRPTSSRSPAGRPSLRPRGARRVAG